MVQGLLHAIMEQESNYRYLLALLMDVDTGRLEGLHPGIAQYPMALKASKQADPDGLTYNEVWMCLDREAFDDAMVQEIEDLQAHKTWDVISKASVPEGKHILPSTWVLWIKHYPDGRVQKHKARFCVRGDKQVKGIDYTDKYAPVVSWSMVWMLLCLSTNGGLASRQVDFSNAFAQSELAKDEEIYVHVPRGFTHPADDPKVLKLR